MNVLSGIRSDVHIEGSSKILIHAPQRRSNSKQDKSIKTKKLQEIQIPCTKKRKTQEIQIRMQENEELWRCKKNE
jgi:hypothetical protein